MRRRTRVENRVRAKIRFRIWLVCAGALIVMALGIYYALERDTASGERRTPGAVMVVLASSGLPLAPLG